MNCDICKRLKERDEIEFYEDKNVLAVLSNKQMTPGKSTVYYKKHVTQFTKLSKIERDELMNSLVKVGRILEKKLKPDHMNYCLLGNYQPHLHWHVFPRYKDKRKDDWFINGVLEPISLNRSAAKKHEVSNDKLKSLLKKIKSV